MSDDQTPIADILKPSTQPAEPAPQEQAPVVEPRADSTGRLHGDGGKFTTKTPKAETPDRGIAGQPTGEAPVTPPVTQPSQPSHEERGLTAALIDQRLEARQAKQERDELRRQLAELQKPKAEPADPWTDFSGAVRQELSPYEQRMQENERRSNFRASKAEVIAEHGVKVWQDINAAVQKAGESGDESVQQLRAEMLQSDDPVRVAMNWFEGRPERVRAKYEAELAPELEAKFREKYGIREDQPQPQTPPVMPSNIAGARNVGTRTGPTWAGPTPLADIFNRK